MTPARAFLVIDDSPLHHQMYKLIFWRGSLQGSTVYHATNGREGYALFMAHPELTLVLLDLNMPEMNGLEFLERRRRTAASGCPGGAGDDRGHAGRRGPRPRGRRLGLSPEAVPAGRRRAAGERASRPAPERGTGMSGDEHIFTELIRDYVAECLPLAEQVTDTFVELERCWQRGHPADDLLRRLEGTPAHAQGQLGDDGLHAAPGARPRARGSVRQVHERSGRVRTRTRPPSWSRAARCSST